MKLKTHLLIVTPLLLLHTLRAADQAWKTDGPTNDWSNDTVTGNENWGTGEAWIQGNNAIFGGTGENVTLTTGISVGNITFNSGGYTIAGNTLTLSSSTINTGANDAAISSTLAGTTGLIKIGTGTLTLSTKPTYSGTTAINEGALTYSFLGGAISNIHSGSGTLNLLPTGGAFSNFVFTNISGFNGTLNYGAGAFSNFDATSSTQLPSATSTINVAAGGEILINNGRTYAGSMIIAGDGIVGGSTPPGGLRAALHLYNATVSGQITLAGNARIGAGNGGPASTLSGGIDTAGYTVTFNNDNAANNSSGAINVTNSITGSGAVVVGTSSDDPFTLTLSGANTYVGNTTVTKGTLTLGNSNVIPDGAGKGNLSVNGTLNLNGKTETVNGLSGTSTGVIQNQLASATSTLTLGANGADGVYNGLIRNNSGTGGTVALVKTGSGTQSLGNSNSYSGGTTIGQGSVVFTHSGALGTGTISIGGGSGNVSLLQSSGGYLANAITVNSQSGGVVTLGGLSTYTGSSLRGFSGNITLNGDVFLQGNPDNIGNRTDFSGSISGAGNVTITGSHKVIFGNNNNNPGLNNTWTGNLTVNSGATLQLGAGTSIGNGIPDASLVTVNGTLALARNAVEAFGGLSGTGSISFNAASDGINIGAGGSFNGAISGSGSVRKSGTGTQTLSGTSNYSGGTTVSGGTLAAGHTNAFGSGSINVTGGELALGTYNISNLITLNGGRLTGTAVSASNVTVGGDSSVTGSFTGTFNTGTNPARAIDVTGGASFENLTGQVAFSGGMVTISGSHTPGNSPGTQTFSSGLTYADNSLLTLEIAASGSVCDFINVTGGGLTIGNNVGLTLALYGAADYTTPFWDINQTFTLITANTLSGDFLGATNLLGTSPDQGSWSYGWNNNSYQATWTAVPEPASAVISSLGLLALLGRRRRA